MKKHYFSNFSDSDMYENGHWVDTITILLEDEDEENIEFNLDEDEKLRLAVTIKSKENNFNEVSVMKNFLKLIGEEKRFIIPDIENY